MRKLAVDGVERDMTPEEEAAFDAEVAQRATEFRDTLEAPTWAIKEALEDQGLLTSADDAINAQPNAKLTKRWQNKPVLKRKEPLTNFLRTALSKNQVEMDSLFYLANALVD